MHGWITLGPVRFQIVGIRLSPRTIEFEAVALLPGGTTVTSPCPARIEDPELHLVYGYTFEDPPIAVPSGPEQYVTIVQTITFTPGGPLRAQMWRDRTPAGRLPGPGRALGPGGPKAIGR